MTSSSAPKDASDTADSASPGAPAPSTWSLWSRWLGRASVAALAVTLVELIVLILPISYAGSSSLGVLAYVWSSHALIVLGLVPVAAFAVLWERRGWLLRVPPASILLTAFVTLLAIVPVLRFLLVFRSGERNDFPGTMIELPSTMLLLVLISAFAIAWFVVWPVSQKLVARYGAVLSRSNLLSACFLGLACLAHWTSYQGLEPINLGHLAGLAAVSGAGLWMLALRTSLRHARPRTLYIAVAPAALFWLLLPLGGSGLSQLHGRFLLFNHSVAARTIAARVHDVFDFDGDGSAPTWLGGTDCAPLDAERGPGIRDVPGDNIDQDCSGKDRTRAQATSLEGSLRCEPSSENLSVLLITIDAWRFDSMFGQFTESITNFARQSLFYSRAYTPANFTRYTVASLLSGRPGSELRAANPLTDAAVASTNALVLGAQEHGMATVAMHHLIFSDEYHAGFGVREAANVRAPDAEASPDGEFLADFRSAGLTDEFLRWLDGIGPKQPFFAWIHYTDPHAPYLNANALGHLEKYNGTYWGEVAYTDLHVSRALRSISERGLAKNTVIAITSDHGEELGEYNRKGHGTNVFENTAHVPLILWVPGCMPEFIEEPVSITQLAPTLAQLAGFNLTGRSLLSQSPSPPAGVVSEAVAVDLKGDERFFKRAFIYGRYKLIDDVRRGGRLLFDLEVDPAETNNIWYEQEEARDAVLEAYGKWLDQAPL